MKKDLASDPLVKEMLANLNHFSKHSFGYPLNTKLEIPEWFHKLLNYHINNVGDPYDDSSYVHCSAKKFERDVLRFAYNLYGLNESEAWGCISHGGTEGNIYGFYLGRERFPEAVMYVSEDSHYSLFKIAGLLRIPLEVVKSLPTGQMDIRDLEAKLVKNKELPAVINVNYGTTMKGAIDDLPGILKVLNKLDKSDYHIHVDAALFGLILPFVEGSPKIDLDKDAHSLAFSLHKFFGCPFPAGVVITKRKYNQKIVKSIEYIDSVDSTIPGSRNGHAAIFAWKIIKEKGFEGLKNEAETCLNNAEYIYKELKKRKLNPLRNPFSNTVLFNRIDEKLMRKWSLAPQGKHIHIVVMQHMDKTVINEFLTDLDQTL